MVFAIFRGLETQKSNNPNFLIYYDTLIRSICQEK